MSRPPSPLVSGYARLIGATLAVQLVLVAVTFPITQLLTAAPLFYIDSPFHWYEIEVAKGLATGWHLLGYDPYFSAGYIGGVGFNVSGKVPAALCILLSPWLDTIVAYKLYVFVAAVLGPAWVPLAARWLGLSLRVALVATLFGVLLWWLSALRWWHTAGMVSFVFGAYLALPYAALIARYLRGEMGWRAFAALVLVGAGGMFLHPLFPLLVAALAVTLTVAFWDEISAHRFVTIYVALPVLCFLPNLVWIWPMLKYPNFATGITQPYQRAVDVSILWKEAVGRVTLDARGSRVNTVLWFAVLWAFAAPLEARARRMAITLAVMSAGLIVFAALGAALPFVATIQPNRFSSAGYLYLSVPASIGVVAVFEALSSRGMRRVAAVGSAASLVLAAAFFARELTHELSDADIPHHGERPPEVRGLGAESAWIVDWLKNHTTADARVLFETSKARIHDEAHMVGYFAAMSQREFIGGPYPYVFFAGFWDDYLFGRPISTFSHQEFTDYLRLYNIGWIVVFSEKTKRFLNEIPELAPLDQFSPIQTYAVRSAPNFFWQGSGKIDGRALNRIELSDLAGSPVVLKYHYVPWLVATPPAQLEPVWLLGDPAPFIRLVDPPPHLVLEMR